MEINVIWAIWYFALYAVLTGAWNMILSVIVAKKADALLEIGFSAACSAEMRYTLALQNCWIVKITSNLALLPLWNVLAMVLWPAYLLALIPTGLYYCHKYYRPDEDSIEEEEVA